MLVSDIIARSMRLNGNLDAGRMATADELADGLFALNTVKRNLFGAIIGPRLSAQSVAATLSGAQAENGGEYQIPGVTFTLTLPANPKSGARVGVADAGLGFGTNPCTVARNGRLLEGAAADLTLGVAGEGRRWWFRGDTGDWVREADYAGADDVIDFPADLAVFLPYMLCVAWAAEFDATLRPDVIQGAARGEAAFARQYGRRGVNQVDGALGGGVGKVGPG